MTHGGIAELKHDPGADGFCMQRFFTTEAAFTTSLTLPEVRCVSTNGPRPTDRLKTVPGIALTTSKASA